MILTIFLLLFGCGLAWLLYRFPLQKAKLAQEYRNVMFFFGFVTLLLLFSAFLAYLGRGGLKLATEAPLTRLAELERVTNTSGVILAGTVSANNELLYSGSVAYIDEEHLWSPKPLWVSLADGDLSITNDDYQPIAWTVDGKGWQHLKAGDPVVVSAFLENTTNLGSGSQAPSLRAEIVYHGSPEAFAARAQSKMRLATISTALNLLAALVIVFIPMRDCLKGIKAANTQNPAACARQVAMRPRRKK